MKNEPEIRDEEILLIRLCRLNFTIEQIESINKLANKAHDWSYFVTLAGRHGIASLICDNLERLGLTGRIPQEQMLILRNTLVLSLSRNAFLLNRTGEIVGLLNHEGIKVVLLKGIALELTIYGNKGLRQMTDADILISRGDYLKAQKILMENGYESTPVKSRFHKPIIEWTGKHLPSLIKNGISIDLHIELFGSTPNYLTEDLIIRAREVFINHEKTYVPEPRLFFLFLVKHLYQHEMNGESQLRLYTDLVVLIDKYRDEIICNELIEDASETGLTKVLAWKLEIIRCHWGISFPDWLDHFIDERFDQDSLNKFVLFLKSPKDNKVDRPGMVYRNSIREIPGLHRKLLFLLGDLFPTFAFMKKRYAVKSNAKALLYYPARVGKIFWLIRR